MTKPTYTELVMMVAQMRSDMGAMREHYEQALQRCEVTIAELTDENTALKARVSELESQQRSGARQSRG